jgi:hypothetical protein
VVLTKAQLAAIHGDEDGETGVDDDEGHQDSTISVFTRDSDGTLRHFYSGHPWLADDVKERGIARNEGARGARLRNLMSKLVIANRDRR